LQAEVNLPDSECGNGVVEGEEPWNFDIYSRDFQLISSRG
jgi:hypothetical protein